MMSSLQREKRYAPKAFIGSAAIFQVAAFISLLGPDYPSFLFAIAMVAIFLALAAVLWAIDEMFWRLQCYITGYGQRGPSR